MMLMKGPRVGAARTLLEALMEEIPDGAEKTDDQLTIEAFLWRQMGGNVLSQTLLDARSQ